MASSILSQIRSELSQIDASGGVSDDSQIDKIIILAEQLRTPAPPSPEESRTYEKLYNEIIEMGKMNEGWEEAIQEHELVDNVDSILASCYDSLLSEIPNSQRTREILGEVGSSKWHTFVLLLIRDLYASGIFYQYGELDTFEDTAGGCDEMTWDAACNLIACWGKNA